MEHGGKTRRVDGTLAQLVSCWVVNAITELGLPFLANSVFSHPPSTINGGSAASAAHRALSRSQQRVAFAMSTHPGFADRNPWVMEAVNAVVRELKFWYRRHSIR
jgi:hypothetical protein